MFRYSSVLTSTSSFQSNRSASLSAKKPLLTPGFDRLSFRLARHEHQKHHRYPVRTSSLAILNLNTNVFQSCRGNNVVAYEASRTSTTTQSSPKLVFDYPCDASLSPAGGKNIDAARTNAFYIINTVHDIAYP